MSLVDNSSEMASVLFSSDLKRSSLFYESILQLPVQHEEDGFRVRHQKLELKVIETNDLELTSDVAVIIHVDNPRELHSSLGQRAIPHLSVLSHSQDQTLRFSLCDPDGNTLYFVGLASASPTHLN